ncbi:hypothetical protein Tco_1281694, partial [Tanacetum coccineum]
ADLGVPNGQVVQTIIPNNAAFQTEDLDTYDSECHDILNAQAVLMANIYNYGSDIISEVPHSETYLNDMENQSVHAMQDFEQTPAEKANKEQNNESVIAELERYKEQVKTFKQRLNIDLSSGEKMFDNVVKIRTTPDARIEGEWGFENTKAVFNKKIIPFLKSLKDIFNVFDKDLLNEIMEVQTVFDQIDVTVQQSSVDKQCLEIDKKELLLENDRLLQQIMSQDVLLTMMNSMSLIGESMNMDRKINESCDKCFNLEAELLKSQNVHNDLLKSYSQLKKRCISLEFSIQLNQEIFQNHESCDNQNALEILEFYENNDLKAQLQDKDTTILKGKEIVDIAAQIPSANTIVPGMFKLDLEPLAPSCAKSAKKHNKQNIWKPTGHVFTEVGLKWKPTGRTFTIVGNSCPLTRITSANVVPPKKTTSHSVETQKPELKVYTMKPKNDKNVGSSKKAKIVDSKNANHSEPNHTWGSNAIDIPSSSSLVMIGIVRFGNDHIARIMGYGDYHLGNVTISRVQYIEGLGRNLFSVG